MSYSISGNVRDHDRVVANAVSEVSEANPYELTEYIRALATSHSKSSPHSLARTIGTILVDEEMVTEQGRKLEDVVNLVLTGPASFKEHKNQSPSSHGHNNRPGPMGRNRDSNNNKNAINNNKNWADRRPVNLPPPPPHHSQHPRGARRHRDRAKGSFDDTSTLPIHTTPNTCHKKNSHNHNSLPPPPPPPQRQQQQQQQQHHTRNHPSRNPNFPRNLKPLPPPPQPNHQHKNRHSLPPPPPPPPLLPLIQCRTLSFSNIPVNITRTTLTNYLQSLDVTVRTSRIQRSNHNNNNHHHPTQSALVELETHDQASYILNSPEPILNNRFITISFHPSNILSDTNPPPSKRPKLDNEEPAPVTPNRPINPTNSINHHLKAQLLQKQETLLQKQILVQKKLLNMFKDPAEKQKKMKEILTIQKKINQVKKESLSILERQNKAAKDAANVIPNPTKYTLDKRTKVILVGNIPEGTEEEDLERHFTPFGKVDFVRLLPPTEGERKETDKNEGEKKDGETREEPPLQQTKITVGFESRMFAEKAKANGSFYNDTTLSLDWFHEKPATPVSSIAEAAPASSARPRPDGDPESLETGATSAAATAKEGAEEDAAGYYEDDDDDDDRWR